MVKKVVTNFDSSKMPDPEIILVVVLKNCQPELSYVLAELFNKCLKELCFLDCWKVSSVVAVFKNVGERSTAKNYCLVSLLSAVRKVFEKLVNNRIFGHQKKCGLFVVCFLLFSVIDGFKWFWMGSLHKNIQLMLKFLKASFLVLHLFYYILMTFLMMLLISNIDICPEEATLYSKCNQASDLWQQLELPSEHESNLRDRVDWDRKWLVDFNAGNTQLVLFDHSGTGAIEVKMDGSVLDEKSYFKMLGFLASSSKLNWGSYIVSIAKTDFKKIGALVCSMKFLSPGVALHLYKSTMQSCMEHCCHVWASAPSCYLELLDKLQKQICRTVGPSLAASIEPLAHL